MVPLLWLIAFACALPTAAKPAEDGNLVFKNAAGNVVATAELTLPDPLPEKDKTFEGKWEIRSWTEFPVSATRNGKYEGQRGGAGVYIDLNPGTDDNNVRLDGSIANGTFSGKWYRTTLSGVTHSGTFVLTLPARR